MICVMRLLVACPVQCGCWKVVGFHLMFLVSQLMLEAVSSSGSATADSSEDAKGPNARDELQLPVFGFVPGPPLPPRKGGLELMPHPQEMVAARSPQSFQDPEFPAGPRAVDGKREDRFWCWAGEKWSSITYKST